MSCVLDFGKVCSCSFKVQVSTDCSLYDGAADDNDGKLPSFRVIVLRRLIGAGFMDDKLSDTKCASLRMLI